MKNSTLCRATLGLAAITACLTMYACGTTGSASSTTVIDPWFTDPITVEFGISNDGTTFMAKGGPEHAGKCVQLTWSDAEGNTISTSTVQADSQGGASGQVPPGAVRWEADVVDCPEPEPVEEQNSEAGSTGGGMFDPLSSQIVGVSSQQAQARKLFKLPLRDHLIQGGPIVPNASGDVNRSYCFVVRAGSFAQAKALVKPIIVGGIGTPVPAAVEVIAFAQMQADAFGARYVQAQPGSFTNWSFNFNNGAFYADQFSALNYQLNGWDVMETAIPLSAFDYSAIPGSSFSNTGTSSYSTNLLAAPVSGSYTFSATN